MSLPTATRWLLPRLTTPQGTRRRLPSSRPTEGGVPKLIGFQRPRAANLIQFSRDGKSLIYVVRENGADNLWQQPLDGSPGKALTTFKAEHIWDYHWSPDGSKLAMVRGHTDSDVVLMRSQQP